MYRILAIAGTLLLTACVTSTAAPQCRVEGGARPEDVARVSAACERAAERFALLFGEEAPAGVVEVSEEIGYFEIRESDAGWRIASPDSERLARFLGGEGDALRDALEVQWTVALPHEMGHAMRNAAAAARRGADTAPRRLPDWFHEGVAVWMEPPAHRADEIGILRALRPYAPQIDSLLAITIGTPDDRAEAGSTIIRTFYPCASEAACGGRPHWSRIFSVTERTFADGTVQIDTTFHEEAPPPPSPMVANFYAYSATLVRYLRDRGGSAAMLAMLDRYAEAEDPASVTLAGLPGLPTTARGVQADWEAWLEDWFEPRHLMPHPAASAPRMRGSREASSASRVMQETAFGQDDTDG